ncbi:hypothetical protein SKAU_G00142530 [Synaphobranchus kaupii]|uniref:Synaptopodin n=1 Tax=Synaphobranchus kaupii TaxID=118154 RepID=A0A9Q1FSK8_SYNKA|nr:hypothetical protein SKAU_G00142530 [Synaphobranchus kaupii]
MSPPMVNGGGAGPSGSVLNRTAQPFAAGFVSHRAATTPVAFHPSVVKKSPPQPATPLPFSLPSSEVKRAVSTTSLYIPPRPAPRNAPPTMFSPPSSVATAPFSPFTPSYTPATPFSRPPVPAPPLSIPPPLTPKVSFNPYVTVATTTPSPPVSGTPTPAPTSAQYSAAAANSAEALSSREQRISVPAARTGLLLEARRRSTKKPITWTRGPKPGRSSGSSPAPKRTSSTWERKPATSCRSTKADCRHPPPVAPKPYTAPEGPQITQMGGKGAELFARRQSRMDRYIVDRTAPAAPPVSPGQPRPPSPTPSLPCHWKYSPNIRAPPPINYNPLLSPSCPPGAQRGGKASQPAKVAKKGAAKKQPLKPLDVMSRQPYQLNSAMFSYGGSAAPAPGYHQSQSISLTAPKQIPIKAARVYNIKRFSTPTPMSAPVSLSPAVIAPRSATTLGEPMWRPDLVSPPPAPLSPPPAPTGALPELPKIYAAPIPAPSPAPRPAGGSSYTPLQNARQWFKSAPELSPLRSAMSGSSLPARVPRPRFSTSSMGIQANVWRPGSVHY